MIHIISGILALGVVVFVHELGHFIVARLCGVTVETFSIGWGPVLFRYKKGVTEYRISALPIGGYCGMKGEKSFREALEKKLDSIPKESDSFYGVHPFKRIAIAFAGPLSNFILAILIFSIVSAVGYSYSSWGNSIIPASYYSQELQTPADKAGLVIGDTIIAINSKSVTNFSEIQQYIATNPGKEITLNILRNGQEISTQITPMLDTKTGIGKIGIYPFVPLKVGAVKPGSAAETVGIRVGDIVVSVNQIPVTHLLDFNQILESKPEQVTIEISRSGIQLSYNLLLLYTEKNTVEHGITWETKKISIPGTNLYNSIIYGWNETIKTLSLTITGISMLFKGVDLGGAVSGPLRITMLIGEAAQTSFASFAQLLGIICISLFLMNLLPIPVLDGGIILLSLFETISRKPLKPIVLYYIQLAGMMVILSIFIFALVNDLRFFAG